MATIYSVRFCVVHVTAPFATPLFTVPAGPQVSVLRDLWVVAAGSPHGIHSIDEVPISGPSARFVTLNMTNYPLDSPTWHWEGRQLLAPGATWEYALPIGAGNDMTVWATGYVFAS